MFNPEEGDPEERSGQKRKAWQLGGCALQLESFLGASPTAVRGPRCGRGLTSTVSRSPTGRCSRAGPCLRVRTCRGRVWLFRDARTHGGLLVNLTEFLVPWAPLMDSLLLPTSHFQWTPWKSDASRRPAA